MDSNNRVEYHIYTKTKGEWFDKCFPAHEYHPSDNFAIGEGKAKYLAGKHGRIWLIKTTCEQIYG